MKMPTTKHLTAQQIERAIDAGWKPPWHRETRTMCGALIEAMRYHWLYPDGVLRTLPDEFYEGTNK